MATIRVTNSSRMTRQRKLVVWHYFVVVVLKCVYDI